MTDEKKPQRRPKGDGAIFRDEKRESWVALFSLGKNASGQRVRRKLRAKTLAELRRRITDEKAKFGGSIHGRTRGTVAEFARLWLESVRINKAANTYAQYSALVETYVIPILGSKRIDGVEVDDISALYARLRRNGVTTSVVAAVATRVRTLFSVAVKQRKIALNPAALVDKPQHRAKETKFLDVDQAASLLLAARGDRLEAFYVLALTAGLRFGELAGLRWEDINLDEGFLSVRQQLLEVNGKLIVGPPKTGKSRRIDLGTMAVDALRRRRIAYEREGHGSRFVFTTEHGHGLRRSNVRRRSFQALLKAAEISRLTIHGLRHSMGAFITPWGPKVLQERLGHSTQRMTLERYAHLLPTLQREAANDLDKQLLMAMNAIEEGPAECPT